MPTNEHSIRLKDPGEFDDKSFRRTHGSGKGMVLGVKIPASIDVIWGKIKGSSKPEDPVIPQALRFPISKWGKDPAKAKAWIEKNLKGKGSFEAAEPKEENILDNDFEVPYLHVFLITLDKKVKHRYETWQDRQQLVVPVVGLVEGVHNGIFYPKEEIEKYVDAWNGIPVPIHHPKDLESGIPVSCNDPKIIEGQCVGRLWNVKYEPDGGKLLGEVWLDVQRANELDSSVVTAILNGGRMEVSTGLWGDHEENSGEWNGESYKYVLHNFRPDHLALLPGEHGACSWNDGCGIRVNQLTEEVIMPQPGSGKATGQANDKLLVRGEDRVIIALAGKLKMEVAEKSHEDIRRAISSELMKAAAPSKPAELTDSWVKDVFDDYFVYEAATKEGRKLFKQNYKITKDEVKIEGTPVEVKEKFEYVELTSDNKAGDGSNEGDSPSVNKQEELEVNMKKEELVKFLIDNKAYLDEDKDMLMALDEKVLERLKVQAESSIAQTQKIQDLEKKVADAEAVANDDADDDEEEEEEEDLSNLSAEEFLTKSKMPEDVRELLQNGVKMHKDKKAQLVGVLVANKRNKFKKEQLEAKSIEELDALVSLANIEPDFTGNVQPRHDDKAPKINERQEDGTGVPVMPTPKWVNGKPDYSHLNS
jgi:hypothetical protein